MLNNVITITELATLTNKSRPTLYKYCALYENGVLDDIPTGIFKLFELIYKEKATKKDVVAYCNKNFSTVEDDIEIKNIIDLLKENKDKIDFKSLKKAIKEGIKK